MRTFGVAVFVCICALSLGASLSRTRREVAKFNNAHRVGPVGTLREASGLAASRIHPNVLYSHDDSGGKPRIIAIDATNGHLRGHITIRGVKNGDWEDMAAGPCPDGGRCLYIGDIGSAGGSKTIIRVKEPSRLGDQTINVESQLRFNKKEANSETLMIDPRGQLYIIDKVGNSNSDAFKIPGSAWGSKNKVTLMDPVRTRCRSKGPGPTGGDISPKGDEILLKTYGHICYYKLRRGESIMQALGRNPDGNVPYKHEPQGEAVAWAANGNGYYTLGEGKMQPLWFYKRK